MSFDQIKTANTDLANFSDAQMRDLMRSTKPDLAKLSDTQLNDLAASGANPFAVKKVAPVNAPLPDRTWGEATLDSGISVAQSLFNVGKSAVGFGATWGGVADRADLDLGLPTINEVTGLPKASEVVGTLNNVNKILEDRKSDKIKEASRRFEEIDTGSEFKDFVESVVYLAQNPAYLADLSLQSIAFLAGGIATGSSMGTATAYNAIMMGGEGFAGAYDKVLQMPQEELNKSRQYADRIAMGDSPADARLFVADAAGKVAGQLNTALGAVTGALGSKLETNAFNALNGGAITAKSAATGVGMQIIQEGIEGGVGQINQNAGVQIKADDRQGLMEGVGKSTATEIMAGAPMSAGIGAASYGLSNMGQNRAGEVDLLAGAKATAKSPGQNNVKQGWVLNDDGSMDVAPQQESSKDNATTLDQLKQNKAGEIDLLGGKNANLGMKQTVEQSAGLTPNQELEAMNDKYRKAQKYGNKPAYNGSEQAEQFAANINAGQFGLPLYAEPLVAGPPKRIGTDKIGYDDMQGEAGVKYFNDQQEFYSGDQTISKRALLKQSLERFPELPGNHVDARLGNDMYRAALQSMSNELERNSGGELVPDLTFKLGESDKPGDYPLTRLPSRNPEWFKNNAFTYTNANGKESPVTVLQFQTAIDKALLGENLSQVQKRIVNQALNSNDDIIQEEVRTNPAGYDFEAEEQQQQLMADAQAMTEYFASPVLNGTGQDVTASLTEAQIDEAIEKLDLGKPLSVTEKNIVKAVDANAWQVRNPQDVKTTRPGELSNQPMPMPEQVMPQVASQPAQQPMVESQPFAQTMEQPQNTTTENLVEQADVIASKQGSDYAVVGRKDGYEGLSPVVVGSKGDRYYVDYFNDSGDLMVTKLDGDMAGKSGILKSKDARLNGEWADFKRDITTGGVSYKQEAMSKLESVIAGGKQPSQGEQQSKAVPIKTGATYRTESGAETTPFPKRSTEKEVNQWLIDNMVLESKRVGNDMLSTIWQNESASNLPPASQDEANLILFGEVLGRIGDRVSSQPINLSKSGKPFSTEKTARISQTFKTTPNAEIVPVEGGFGVREGLKPTVAKTETVAESKPNQAIKPAEPKALSNTTLANEGAKSSNDQANKPAQESQTPKQDKQDAVLTEPKQSQEKTKVEVENSEADALIAEGLDMLMSALGGKTNVMPEAEGKVRDALGMIMRGLAKKGFIKFEEMVKQIYNMLNAKDAEMAKKIQLEDYQGAYMQAAKDTMATKQDKMDAINFESLKEVLENVERATNNQKPDSTTNAEQTVESNNGNEGRGSERPSVVKTSDQASEVRNRDQGSVGNSSAIVDREPSVDEVYSEKSQLETSTAGSANNPGSVADSTGGLYAGRSGAGKPSAITKQTAGRVTKGQVKAKSANGDIKPGDYAQITEMMPFLTEGQKQDVVFAETRLAKDDGFGVMFTNGTGTGKTFTGLGTVKRMVEQGKNSILIAVPKQPIADAWIKAGKKFFGLDITGLLGTKDSGTGIVVTTFANMGQNSALINRQWDAFVMDESHYLSSNEKGDTTSALKTLRSLALKDDSGSINLRAQMLMGERYDELIALRKKVDKFNLSKDIKTPGELDDHKRNEAKITKLYADLQQIIKAQKEFIANTQDKDKPRAIMLSATPFAYEKNVDIGNGFLFSYGKEPESRAYNGGGAYEQFMVQHFGYRMRYGKLTEPDAKVERGLMQRNFNAWLKKQGVLSGRALDSDFDYDRKFVLTESAIGKRVDDALEWLRTSASRDESFGLLQETITGDNFDYHNRMYFLEAIKASQSVGMIQQHLDQGRKVVVMHDFKKGGIKNPFRIGATAEEMKQAYAEFESQFSDLIEAFDALPSTINTLTRAFPGALVYNGDVPAKQRVKMQDDFNSDDDSSPKVIVAQGDAMREGVSIHDTTGKFPRVLIHLGMPTKPTAAIQQEGRIYRTGQASNAMFRYMTIGSAWERHAFASKIASRASTAENLALGESARGLKESFINAYEEADIYPAGFEGEGVGGKENDAAMMAALTPWDQAKGLYYGVQKQGKGRSSNGRAHSEYFATPEPVGFKMVQFADMMAGDKALEPSAGHGAIARFFPENVEKRAIEYTDALSSKLSLHFDGDLMTGDFMDHNIINKYDSIVMNPPYGQGGKQAAEHVGKAMKHLRNGGRIVALIPTGPAADKQFSKLFESDTAKDIYTVANIFMPTVTFERAGTSVSTRIVVLEKQTDSDLATNLQEQNQDYRDIKDMGELFDRMENFEVKPRAKSVEQVQQEKQTEQAEKAVKETGFKSWDAKHTKTNADLFLTKPVEQLERDDYLKVSEIAKKNNGYWNRFSKGFSFETTDNRQSFIDAVQEQMKKPDTPMFSRREDGANIASQTQEKSNEPIEITNLRESINEYTGKENSYQESDIGLPDNLRQTLEETFGKRIIGFTTTSGFDFNGVVLPDSDNAIYINANADKPLMAVAGHEFMHSLKQDNQELYKQTLNAMYKVGGLQGYNAYKGKMNAATDAEGVARMSHEKIQEEMMADILGDNFMRPEFWAKVSQHLDEQKPGLFNKLMQAVKAFLKTLYNAISPLGSNKFVKDVEAAQDVVVEFTALHMKSRMGNEKAKAAVSKMASDLNDIVLSRNAVRDNGKGSPSWEAAKAKGLDMSKEARLERARTMGFDTDTVYYHVGRSDFAQSNQPIFWASETRSLANDYAMANPFSTDGANVTPVYLNPGRSVLFRHAEQRKSINAVISEALSQSPIKPKILNKKEFDNLTDILNEKFGNEPRSLFEFWYDSPKLAEYFRFLGFDSIKAFEKQNMKDATVGVLYPENIRSINAAFDPEQTESPNILFSRRNPQTTITSQGELGKETTWDRLMRTQTDSFHRFQKLDEWMEKEGLLKDPNATVYKAEATYHGRVATRIEDFREQQLKPLIQAVKKTGYTLDDVEMFLHAQHAEERNIQIEKINQNIKDGSGMDTDTARDILANADPKLVKVANDYRKITDQTKETLLDSGILSKEQVEAWDSAYQHYVPLRGGDDAMTGTGKGFTPSYKVKRALGHNARDEHILENIQQAHERAIMAVEKNRVSKFLLRQAIDLGNPDIIDIGNPQKRAVLRDGKAYSVMQSDGLGGESVVESFTNKQDAQRFIDTTVKMSNANGFKLNPNNLTIKVSSDPAVIYTARPTLDDNETIVYSSGQTVRIQINDPMLAQAYKNMGVEKLNSIMQVGGTINNYLSRVYTAYAPEFIFVNMIRDFFTGIPNIAGEKGALFAAKSVKNYPKAAKLLSQYHFTGKEDPVIKSYREEGGTTGAAYLSDLERLGSDAKEAYDTYAGFMAGVKNGKPGRAARLAGKNALVASLRWLENANATAENAFRLAVYMSAMDENMSKIEAANLAKNATVNFNRKGEIGRTINALYLFHNAAVQGSSIIAKALFKSKHKHQVQALTAGMVSLGVMTSLLMGGAEDDEWEKLPAHVKERNWAIRTADGWSTLPIPYGYGFFSTLGRTMGEVGLGKMDIDKAAIYIAHSLLSETLVFGNAYNPEDPTAESSLFLMPTMVQLPGAPVINMTGLGSPVRPETYNSSTPDSELMWRNTEGSLWSGMARGVNALTGGDQVRQGWVSASPETYKYWWNTLTGGLGRSVTDGGNAVWLMLNGSDVETREVPIARKFVRNDNIGDTRRRFQEYKKEVKFATDQFARVKKTNDAGLINSVVEEQRELLALGKLSNKYQSTAGALRDRQIEIKMDKSLTLSERRLKLKMLEKEEAEIYDEFISVYKEEAGRVRPSK